MTNTNIIYQALQARGFSEDQLNQIIAAYNGDLPFHTFAEWKARGYSVKKGEKALLAVPLWKYTNKPNMAARKAAEARGEEINEDPHYYKKLSYIFGFNQVKRTGAKDPDPVKVETILTETTGFMAPVLYKKPCTALAVI